MKWWKVPAAFKTFSRTFPGLCLARMESQEAATEGGSSVALNGAMSLGAKNWISFFAFVIHSMILNDFECF